MRGIGVFGDGISDGDGRRQRHMVSGNVGGGVRDRGGTDDSRNKQQGQSEAMQTAE